MCSLCRSKKEIDRAIRNERIRNDQLHQKVKQIRSYLDSLKCDESFDNKTDDFYSQLAYYKDKLNHKEITREAKHDQYDKELPVVSSKDDIIQWCNQFHQKLKEDVKEWRRS